MSQHDERRTKGFQRGREKIQFCRGMAAMRHYIKSRPPIRDCKLGTLKANQGDCTIFDECIKIFREFGLKDKLDVNEMVEADAGYRGEPRKIRSKDDFHSSKERKEKERIRARHETVNRRFKQFNILGHRFRHDLSLHKFVFRAIAVLTQIDMTTETHSLPPGRIQNAVLCTTNKLKPCTLLYEFTFVTS